MGTGATAMPAAGDGSMKRYTLDCRTVRTFADFVEAANAGFIRASGGEWNGHLDAFNDFLAWPDEGEYELELVGATLCAASLGHEAMALWLRQKLETCHSGNAHHFRSRLEEAEQGHGQTLFELLGEIIADNPHVRVILA